MISGLTTGRAQMARGAGVLLTLELVTPPARTLSQVCARTQTEGAKIDALTNRSKM